ncbi:glycosyl hydrolase [Paraburkholderia acidiphila]|uniref:Glycosyl hydrolase n=2 Tax=Paraburkholderia acidiphila TaxID=2571747 RepID=A0A7Z2JAM1_9BURK|nr:glycosyl hydrolase [Paraburkholderia acidiphila]
MKKYVLNCVVAVLAVGGTLLAQEACADAADKSLVQVRPADADPYATSEMLLAQARAGRRLVAVGDSGVVVLSDNDGKAYRQAKQVPSNATLTSVVFTDASNGWAVGHWGTILHTTDGGETWQLQHSDPTTDRPFFSVYFSDAQHGVAAGLWSLLMRTDDGGKHWQPINVPPPPGGGHADKNLFSLFSNQKGVLFIAAEHGLVLRSSDGGITWTYLDTGYKGSLWTGLALVDGGLLVGGLRGSLYRSDDDGVTWHRVDSGTHSSITSIAQRGKHVVAACLDGVIIRSADGGKTFTASQRNDHLPLTSVAIEGDSLVALSKSGVVVDPGTVN